MEKIKYMDEFWYCSEDTGEYSEEDVFWKSNGKLIGKGKIPARMFCNIFYIYYEKYTLCQLYNEEPIEIYLYESKKDYRHIKKKSSVYMLFNTDFDKKVKSIEFTRGSLDFQHLIECIVLESP